MAIALDFLFLFSSHLPKSALPGRNAELHQSFPKLLTIQVHVFSFEGLSVIFISSAKNKKVLVQESPSATER